MRSSAAPRREAPTERAQEPRPTLTVVPGGWSADPDLDLVLREEMGDLPTTNLGFVASVCWGVVGLALILSLGFFFVYTPA